jgi:hypothetical protein
MTTKHFSYEELITQFEDGEAMYELFVYEDMPATLKSIEKFERRFVGNFDSPGVWLCELNDRIGRMRIGSPLFPKTADWEAEAEALAEKGLYVYYYDDYGNVNVFKTKKFLKGLCS